MMQREKCNNPFIISYERIYKTKRKNANHILFTRKQQMKVRVRVKMRMRMTETHYTNVMCDDVDCFTLPFKIHII